MVFLKLYSGSLGFHSRCEEDFSETLMLPQRNQASFQLVMGTSGFLLSYCMGRSPHLEFRWKLRVRVLSLVEGEIGVIST